MRYLWAIACIVPTPLRRRPHNMWLYLDQGKVVAMDNRVGGLALTASGGT